MKKFYHALLPVVLFCINDVSAQNGSPYWSLSGNSNASASSKLGTTNSIPLRLLTNNTERVRIDESGKVGIGLTAPKGKLSILGSGTTPASSWVSSGVPIFAGFGENTPGNADDILGMASNTSNARAVFMGRKSRGTLAAPTAVQNNDYILTFYASAYDGNGTFQAPATIDFMVDGAVASGSVPSRISFATGSNFSNRTERLRIGSNGDVNFNSGQMFVQKSTGRVGFGTTTPSYMLDARNFSAGYGIYGFGIYSGIVGEASGSVANEGKGVSGNGYYGGYFYGYETGIVVNNGSSTGYAGYFGGDVYAAGNYTSSDQKLKQNIEDAPSSLALIAQLKPKRYEYRQDGAYKAMNLPTGQHYGLIAQDVEKVLPNLVKNSSFKPAKAPSGTDNGAMTAASAKVDFKALNYTELIPILVGAVQEQQEQIIELKKQIEYLSGQSSQLKAGTLGQNMPNPGSSATRVAYSVPASARQAQLVVFDQLGSRLQVYSVKGTGSVNINTTGLTNGVYHYSLIIDNAVADTKQMIIVR